MVPCWSDRKSRWACPGFWNGPCSGECPPRIPVHLSGMGPLHTSSGGEMRVGPGAAGRLGCNAETQKLSFPNSGGQTPSQAVGRAGPFGGRGDSAPGLCLALAVPAPLAPPPSCSCLPCACVSFYKDGCHRTRDTCVIQEARSPRSLIVSAQNLLPKEVPSAGRRDIDDCPRRAPLTRRALPWCLQISSPCCRARTPPGVGRIHRLRPVGSCLCIFWSEAVGTCHGPFCLWSNWGPLGGLNVTSPGSAPICLLVLPEQGFQKQVTVPPLSVFQISGKPWGPASLPSPRRLPDTVVLPGPLHRGIAREGGRDVQPLPEASFQQGQDLPP